MDSENNMDSEKYKLFMPILNEWKWFITTNLIPIIKQSGELLEGNIYADNLTTTYDTKYFLKQFNIYVSSIQPNVQHVLEIGFNSGFSALLILLSNPTIKITCVDINYHTYLIPCFNVIKSYFGDRITLIIGNSVNILPILTDKYDLIHIDGCHDPSIAKIDIMNSKILANNNCLFIMDDVDYAPLRILWNQCIHDYNLETFDGCEDTEYHSIKKYVQNTDIVFYTCFFGNNDNIANVIPLLPSNTYDCYFFTNNVQIYNYLQNTGWNRIFVQIPIKTTDTQNAYDSKKLKTCPHHFDILNKYTNSCYFDSKINVDERKVIEYVNNMLIDKKPYLMPEHPFLNGNIWSEYNECLLQPRYAVEQTRYLDYINKQLDSGLKHLMEYHYTTHFIVRQNTAQTNIINDTWYKHINECGIECQISFFFIQQLFGEHIYTIKPFAGYAYRPFH